MPKLLLIAETDGKRLLPSLPNCVSFAKEWCAAHNGAFDILVIGGSDISSSSEFAKNYGAEKVLVVSDEALSHPLADIYADVIGQVISSAGADSVCVASSAFGRDILPRVAEIAGISMVSDVLEIVDFEGAIVYKRPMYAGNVIATVKTNRTGAGFTIRITAFVPPPPTSETSPIESVPVTIRSMNSEFISIRSSEQSRPDLSAARVVVSGGRPLKDPQTFESVIGGLADKLGGAVGATRAAVDSGIAPNELQVGQTGKVVAPDLYIAAGVSGSVQHIAGMKDSKVIVAINTDPDAPIFEVADYGLVADLFTAIPELTAQL